MKRDPDHLPTVEVEKDRESYPFVAFVGALFGALVGSIPSLIAALSVITAEWKRTTEEGMVGCFTIVIWAIGALYALALGLYRFFWDQTTYESIGLGAAVGGALFCGIHWFRGRSSSQR